jgi:CPA2 family monovalent cation:H+ antiporter-2
MLLDPAQIVPNAALTAATLAVIWVGKPLVAFGLLLALKAPVRTALSVGLAIGQIGEFSFILAALGRQIGVLPERATQALVAASIISITVSPFLFRLVDPLARFLEARGVGRGEARKAEGDPPAHGRHAILVGHGPVGRTLARLLRENGVRPVIIEQNEATVATLAQSGVQAIHGDAADPAVLERAGVRQAGSLVFAASGSPGRVVEAARTLNPALLILARTTYASEVGSMREAGANVVVSAEGEVALAMTERLLQQLGAEGDQVDRARDRVRTELGGDPPAPDGAH